jgi:hypothetical protein
MSTVLPASVRYFEKYYEEQLNPGEAVWKKFPPSPVFAECAVVVTASARPDLAGGVALHVLKVDDVNITMIPGVVHAEFELGFNVINNGDTTIGAWTVTVGLIGP